MTKSFKIKKGDQVQVIAGKDSKVLMIEAEGREVPEDVVYGAVDFSIKHLDKLSAFISEVAAAATAVVRSRNWRREKVRDSVIGILLNG